MPCVFCRSTDKLTREHLWPKWLRERGILSDTPVPHSQGQEAPAETWDRRWNAPEATQTARIVCERCNGGWMNDLESEAAPILAPMMWGDAATLDVAKQATVAVWAAKMTMVWEAINPRVRSVSREDYEHIYRWRSPPTDWRVWIAAFPPAEETTAAAKDGNTYYYKHPLRLRPSDVHHADRTPVRAEEVNGHLATFGVREFGFQTFGAFGDLDVGRPAGLHEQRFAPYLRRIWPSVTPVRWPPDRILDARTLKALTDSWLV